MTIKQLKEVIAKAEASGVPETARVYTEQENSNETSCFLVVKDKETKQVVYTYIADQSPDELIECLEEENNVVEIIE